MSISVSLTKLVEILYRLAPLSPETIQLCLRNDSASLDKYAIQAANLEVPEDSTMTKEKAVEY